MSCSPDRSGNPHDLVDEFEGILQARLGRRALLAAGGAAMLSLSATARAAQGATSLLGAQAGDSAKLISYIGWYGPNVFKDFGKAYPGKSVKPVIINVDEDRIAKLATDHSAADMVLITEKDVQRFVDLGIAQKIDLSKVPNYRKNVAKAFRTGLASDAKAMAVATDFGWTGYGYRRDLVGEKMTSWADLWRLKKKLKGKITLLDYSGQTLPSVLMMLGYSPSSRDPAQIKAAGKKLRELKPYIQSFAQTDMTKGLLDGSVMAAMDWNYDMGPAMARNKNIEWVTPKDGALGYLDTWVANRYSKNLDVVYDFMNYNFRPAVYAKFVNYTGTAYVMPAAKKFIKPSLRTSKLLFLPPDELKRIVFGKPVGRAQAIYDEVWADVKAS